MPANGRFNDVEILELIPVAKCKSTEESGIVWLLLPRFSGLLLGAILQPMLPDSRAWIKVKLDDKGVTIWDAINNSMTVRDIIRKFIRNNPDDSEQASDRVWQYLLHMERHGMIDLKEKDS